MKKTLYIVLDTEYNTILEKNYKWIYLSRNYINKKKWLTNLNIVNQIIFDEQLKNISKTFRGQYIEFMAEIGKNHWKHWEWWLTPIANRSSLREPIFLYFCYLLILKNVIEEINHSIYVIIENEILFKIISNNFSDDFEIIELKEKKNIIEKIGLKKQELKSFILNFLFVIKRFKIIKNKTKKLNSYSNLKSKKNIVIHTCVLDSCFRDQYNFVDHFFPGLYDYLTSKNYNVSTLLWFYNGIEFNNLDSYIEILLSSKKKYIIPEQYLSSIDFIKSYYSLLKGSRLKLDHSKCSFNKINFFDLLTFYQKEHLKDLNLLYFISLKHVFYRWKQKNYKIDALFLNWEHKFFEVPAAKYIKKYYNNCKTFSYQHGALLPHNLMAGYKFSKNEFFNYPHCDIGLVNSQANFEYFKNEGFPLNYLRLFPAFRYSYLNNKVLGNGKEILIALPSNLTTNIEILDAAFEGLININTQINIKFHPGISLNTPIIKKYLENLPPNFKIVNESINMLLENTRLLISNGSGTLVEALYAGINVICYTPENDVDYNPINDTILIKTNILNANDADSLKVCVERFYCSSNIEEKDKSILFEFDYKKIDNLLEEFNL